MATEKQRDDLDLEEYTLEQIKQEFQEVYNEFERLKYFLEAPFENGGINAKVQVLYDQVQSRMQQVNEKFEKINKNIQLIKRDLDSIYKTEDKEIKKYLAEINIDEQLEKYDEKRRKVMQKDYDNLKHYFTQIVGSIDERLTELDDYIKNNLLQQFNTKNRDIQIKIEEIKEKIDNIQEKIESMDGYPTDVVVSDEEEERGTSMDVEIEKLQQRVDDILKF